MFVLKLSGTQTKYLVLFVYAKALHLFEIWVNRIYNRYVMAI